MTTPVFRVAAVAIALACPVAALAATGPTQDELDAAGESTGVAAAES